MQKNLYKTIILLISLFIVVSCTKAPLDEEVDYISLTGYVLDVVNQNPYLIDMGLVSDYGTQIVSVGRISVSNRCIVMRVENGTLKRAGFSELAVGQKIGLKVKEVLEGFSATASEITILTPGSVEAGEPMSLKLLPEFFGMIRGINNCVDESHLSCKLITVSITDSPDFPEESDVVPAFGNSTLTWLKENNGYVLTTTEAVKTGSIVSVLLRSGFSPKVNTLPSSKDPNFNSGFVQEFIVFPEAGSEHPDS